MIKPNSKKIIFENKQSQKEFDIKEKIIDIDKIYNIDEDHLLLDDDHILKLRKAGL